MSRGVQRLGLLLGVLLGTLAAAEEYPSLGFRMMSSSQNPFPYYVDSRDPKPAGIDLALVVQATQNAFQTWESVDCAYTDFDYKGPSGAAGITTVGDTADRYNVAPIWVTSKLDPNYERALAEGYSASAAVPLTFGGALYQCDIFLNAVDFKWSTLSPAPAGHMDLQSVLTHEIGHCQGLADVYGGGNNVMRGDLQPGMTRRALASHDVQHLCALAPQTGAVGSPCPAGTCSSGFTCLPTQTPDGASVKLCSTACTGSTPGECPDPYVCRASGTTPSMACLPPTQAVTQVGKDCASASSCGSGRALCMPPETLFSGTVAWRGGYCTQACGAGQPACPSGSTCTQAGSSQLCLKSCRPGTADCRVGYACSLRPEGNVCVPECNASSDCNSSGSTEYSCRLCDNVCIKTVQGARAVGETCAADSECNTGLTCLRYPGNATGVCAQPCAVTACGCPFGTNCQPVGLRGESLCVSDCTPGSCPEGTLCTPSGDGAACLPPNTCKEDADCPRTFRCTRTGMCYDPTLLNVDAGTPCSLCNDGGTPPPPPPPSTDGGTGDGGASGPGGCGCQGAPASAMNFFAALALLLALRGRRTWPHP